tara:strand:+ start:628 stop:759 length:132 start_codon:yes stop_codon:yes gene_type:complete
MINIINKTAELAKEIATLRSPGEVYVFVVGVWLIGVACGAIFG